VSRVEIAKTKGAFPGDVSVLEVHSELEWNPAPSRLTAWPLYLNDNGCIILYRLVYSYLFVVFFRMMHSPL